MRRVYTRRDSISQKPSSAYSLKWPSLRTRRSEKRQPTPTRASPPLSHSVTAALRRPEAAPLCMELEKINTTVPAANSVNSTRSTIRRTGVRSLSVRRPFVWFCCIIDNPFRANTFAGLSKKLHTGCGARGARFTVPQRHLHLANVGFAQQQHAQAALADAAADGQRQLIR